MTQDRDLKFYILCRKKNIAFERKEMEGQEQGCAGKSLLWDEKQP